MTFRHGLTASCDEGEHVAMSRIGETMRHPVAEKIIQELALLRVVNIPRTFYSVGEWE